MKKSMLEKEVKELKIQNTTLSSTLTTTTSNLDEAKKQLNR
jgi:hypothetical protein